MIEHTYIDFLGLELADPLTFMSDVLMALFCAVYGHRLYHNFKSMYEKYAGLFFLFLAFSSFLGGVAHLLDVYVEKTPHLIAWSIQGVSVLFFQLSSLTLLQPTKTKFVLKGLIYSLFAFYIFQVFSVQEFDIVKLNSTIGLIGVASSIHIYKYVQERNNIYLKTPLAIVLFAIPALIHSLGLSYNSWVDHNVISHVLLIPCYYLLYLTLSQLDTSRVKTTPIFQEIPIRSK